MLSHVLDLTDMTCRIWRLKCNMYSDIRVEQDATPDLTQHPPPLLCLSLSSFSSPPGLSLRSPLCIVRKAKASRK